jgi:hypothetical protein
LRQHASSGCDRHPARPDTPRPDSPLARFVHQLVETRSEEPTSRADSGETQLTAHTREEHSLARALAHVIACLCTARTATRFGWGGRHRLHTHMLIERAASRRSTTRRRWMLSVAPIQIPSPQAIVCAAETVRTSSVPFLTSWLRRCTLQSSTRPKMRLSAEWELNQKPTHGRPFVCALWPGAHPPRDTSVPATPLGGCTCCHTPWG